MTVEALRPLSQCVICAAELDPRARKCTKCGAWQDGVECAICGMTMPAGAVQCPSCKAFKEGKRCLACGEMIGQKSRRCGPCGTWQTRRRFLSFTDTTLALILSIVSVTGATIVPVFNFFTNRSNTYLRVVGDAKYQPPDAGLPEDAIRVTVVNSGSRQSVIRTAAISFDDALGAETTTLDLLNDEHVFVKGGERADLYLSAGSVARRAGKTKEQVLQRAKEAKQFATITLSVVETSWSGESEVPRTHRFETKQISQWMDSHVASN